MPSRPLRRPAARYQGGAVLSFPLFDGGTRLGTIKTQQAAEDIAAQTLDTQKRQAIIQVEQAQRGIAVAEAVKARLAAVMALTTCPW